MFFWTMKDDGPGNTSPGRSLVVDIVNKGWIVKGSINGDIAINNAVFRSRDDGGRGKKSERALKVEFALPFHTSKRELRKWDRGKSTAARFSEKKYQESHSLFQN